MVNRLLRSRICPRTMINSCDLTCRSFSCPGQSRASSGGRRPVTVPPFTEVSTVLDRDLFLPPVLPMDHVASNIHALTDSPGCAVEKMHFVAPLSYFNLLDFGRVRIVQSFLNAARKLDNAPNIKVDSVERQQAMRQVGQPIAFIDRVLLVRPVLIESGIVVSRKVNLPRAYPFARPRNPTRCQIIRRCFGEPIQLAKSRSAFQQELSPLRGAGPLHCR